MSHFTSCKKIDIPDQINAELQHYSEYYIGLAGRAKRWERSPALGDPTSDSQVFTSAFHNLECIRLIIQYGWLESIYSILRRYHHTIIMHAYDLATISGQQDPSLVTARTEKMRNNKYNYPPLSEMEMYLSNADRLSHPYNYITSTEEYKNLKERLSWNMHLNGMEQWLTAEEPDPLSEKLVELQKIMSDARTIFTLHFLTMAFLKDKYIRAGNLTTVYIYPDGTVYKQKNGIISGENLAGSYSEMIFWTVHLHFPEIAEMIRNFTGIIFKPRPVDWK